MTWKIWTLQDFNKETVPLGGVLTKSGQHWLTAAV